MAIVQMISESVLFKAGVLSGSQHSSLFSCRMRGFYGVEFTDAHSCRDCLTYGFFVGSVMPFDAMPACLGVGLVLRWMLYPMHSPKAMRAPF